MLSPSPAKHSSHMAALVCYLHMQITQNCKTYAKQGSSFSMAPKSLDLSYVLKYREEHCVSEESYMVEASIYQIN